VPLKQKPLPPQWLGQVGTEQSAPAHPSSQMQFRLEHEPWPEQFFGHPWMEQSGPERPAMQ
jgi:hypothetical protein